MVSIRRNKVSVDTLVIGNGESRSTINLTPFLSNHILVGCNAIHRDIQVTHLICCDRRMIEESIASKNTSKTKIYVRNEYIDFYSRNDERIKVLPQLPYQGKNKIDMPIHWGSGPYSLLVSAGLQSNRIKLIGFDLYSKNNFVNNIYKDSKHYNKKDSKPIDHSFWEYQIAKVFEYFPNKEFIIYNSEDWKMPNLWKRSNVSFEVLATKNLTFA